MLNLASNTLLVREAYLEADSGQARMTIYNPRVYNIRPCPYCETEMYGMPGGRDAVCNNCGFKEPCCGD